MNFSDAVHDAINPLRTIVTRLLSPDGSRSFGSEVQHTRVDENGDIRIDALRYTGGFDCGHASRAHQEGGVCMCGRVSCMTCFDLCGVCRGPLGNCCATTMDVRPGFVRVCPVCVPLVKKALFWECIWRFFFKP